LESDAATFVLENIHVSYGGVPAVNGVGLEINSGEIISVLGANGSGRSSLLLAASGFVPSSGGKVRLKGLDITDESPDSRARLGIHLIPENRGLFPSLTVNDHLRLACRGDHKALIDSGVLSLFPYLKERPNQPAGSLSGGEAQMLAVALAVVVGPSVLLIDELSFGLAPAIVARLLEVVRSMADSSGTAVVLVEQFVDLALEVSNRAVVMSQGHVSFAGPAALLRNDHTILREAYLGQTGSP